MNRLLKLTAFLETPTGLALIVVPAFVVRLLLRAEISGAAITLGRVSGLALLALGVACWLASYDEQSCAGRGVVSAMAIYNLGVVLVLGAAGIQSPPVGILCGRWSFSTRRWAPCVSRRCCGNRPEMAANSPGKELGVDHSRPGMEYHPAPLWAA